MILFVCAVIATVKTRMDQQRKWVFFVFTFKVFKEGEWNWAKYFIIYQFIT